MRVIRENDTPHERWFDLNIFSRKETHSRLSRLKLLASFTTNFYYRSQTRGSPLSNWKECNILRLKHYNQDNMKLLLLEIYDVDEEEE